MRAYVDSSVVLDALDPGSARARRFATATSDLVREWCVSPFVRMECLVRPYAQGDSAAETQARLTLATMTMLDVPAAAFDLAARLRAAHGLKALDALHVATALQQGCAELWTADARLARAAVPGLAIRLVA